MKICFLASGKGGNFKFLNLAKKLGIISNVDLFLIADRDCDSLEYAKKNKIFNKKIHYKKSDNTEFLKELEIIDPDIIITNWHKIIDVEVVNKYQGKLINLHYSLLPAFDGLIGIEPIKQAYDRSCSYIGATCHYVDEGVDSGGIISQSIIKADIPIEVAIQKIFEKGCLILLNSILVVSNKEIIIKKENNKFEYSPDLLFDDNQFNEIFWNQLRRT